MPYSGNKLELISCPTCPPPTVGKFIEPDKFPITKLVARASVRATVGKSEKPAWPVAKLESVPLKYRLPFLRI
jgi:hypothetical protein